MTELGFIILRHVKDKNFNKYWQKSYECIRKFYPENKILIIDDNSNYDLIDTYYENYKLYKTKILRSEYKGRGELLPYYYFNRLRCFDVACIIHDNVFINKNIDFSTDDYKFIWDIKDHQWDQIEDEYKMLSQFKDNNLLKFYQNKKLWNGCYGGMSIITHKCLQDINKKYDLSILLSFVTNRYHRMSFERVLGCLLQYYKKNDSLYGHIHDYCKMEVNANINDIDYSLPIIKLWAGR